VKAARKSRDNKRLAEFGKHLEGIIYRQGYASVYDFWIRRAGDDISRAALNLFVKGEREPKLFTLLLLAELLEVTPQQLLKFGEQKKRGKSAE
jgi:transcriptional regulator with XRE-family HTH domain